VKQQKIKYIDLSKKYFSIKKNFSKSLNKIFKKGDFISGKSVTKLEKNLQKFTNSHYVLACGNGSDALELGLKVLGIGYGDHVLTVSNTWISAVNAIRSVGAKPIFVDIDNTLNICVKDLKKKINKRIKAIILVHLNGLPCEIEEILKILKNYNIKVIEDCSQSIGSTYKKKHVGNFSDLATYSMHPTKNLGVFGDGGFIATNSFKNYKKIKIIQNHGLKNRDEAEYVGRNSRLDNIQAEVALLLLKRLNQTLKKRINNSKYYENFLNDMSDKIILPHKNKEKSTRHTFHRYVILCKKKRNKLFQFLTKNGIDVKIHYPKDLHEQKPFKKFYKNDLINTERISGQVLSLPISETLKYNEIKYICNKIKFFFSRK
jgi:dTDP-4-amino-4,6-dideoxygalactose transaminase